MSEKKTKLLVIGLDAAEQSLIRRWIASGDLPNLANFGEQSLQARTTNEPGLYTGSVWPSIFTGASAGRHGCYYYRQIVNGTYGTSHFRPDQLKHPPFWKALSDAGRRVAMVDIPKSMLTEGINGIQVVDWGLHDPSFPSVQCWPPALAQELTERFGVDPVGQCDAADRTPAQYRDLCQRLVARIDRKRELIRYLLGKEDWDLFFTVFGDSHCAGHQFWHLHEAENGAHASPGPADRPGDRPGDLLKDVYVALDKAIGELVAAAGPETDVMVFTSHGFGSHYDANHLLDEALRRLEGAPGSRWPRIMHPVRALYRSALPVDLRTRLRPLAAKVFDGVENIDDISAARIRQGRKCFMLPSNDNCGNIRVNLVGREPHGLIRPGSEFDAFFSALAEDLMQIVNLETGGPVVKEVLKTADHFAGDHLDDLPDIVVRYHREAKIRRIASPKIGDLEGENTACRSGDHRPEGLLLVRGPQFGAGQLNEAVPAMDLAPTIAAMLGVELRGVDGAAVAALVRQ